MKADEARALFHGKDKLNCAQAVLKAFQAESGMSDSDILAFASAGGGRGEGGVCGALLAASALLQQSAVLQDLERDFETEAGSILCKGIRGLNRLPCRECVALAAGFLERHKEGIRRTEG